MTQVKKNVQLRNNLLSYYPKEYALLELTPINSFTDLKIVKSNSDIEQNQNTYKNKNPKSTQQKDSVQQTSIKPEPKTPQKERKNRKPIKKFPPQDEKEKSEHRESSRLRSQPRTNYETFIPQSKILKKIDFQKQF